ncbi:NACHT domain-containing protein [Kribbella sp. VKM Ac-2527]|uniref:NACHT domain-containing protein n=1 Tax=Kribbella caucasensis TaxID=2512215 RepID=A0A4V3CBE6_9ACTN|nr:NACHT domain-containing protein [Kribbella sp. VKM Ac-2527]
MLRVVVVVLALSLTVVLLPIAINIGTGGTAPAFLAPYAKWTWPAIGFLWLAAIVTGIWEFRSRRTVTHSARSADQPRNRPNALARIDRHLADRFTGSLAARTRLALALDESPDAVIRPYDLLVQPLHSTVTEIREDADIAAAFDDLQDSMLILGAPGSGKTTLLLDLARSLAAEAHNDPDQPIPVLVDLAGWGGPGTPRSEDDDPGDSALLAGFVHWLLGQLANRYGIPAPVGRVWLRRGRLALLLDGVDEIAATHRDKLGPVLEELRRRYLIGQLAVTCRIHDYERLPQPLSLYGAVRIRPLTRHQVLDYFATVGHELDGARVAIEQDDDLWDLVDSPLMLNVLALAYQGRDAAEIASGAVEDHRRELFDIYISEVLSRYRPASREYDSRTAVRSLWCLAWWTRTRAGDRIAVPRWLTPNGWYGLVLPVVGYLAHMVCLPALFAGLVGGAALATTALYGVPAGLAVGASSLLLVHIRPRTWRVFRDGPEQPRFLLTAAMVGCGVVAGFLAILAGTGVVALLPTWGGLALAAAAIGASYGFELMVSHGNRRRALLLGVRLTVVTVATWLVIDNADEPRVFVAGLVAGLIVAQGIRLVKAMPMDHLVYPHSADEPDSDWRLGRMDYWVLAGIAVAIVAALALGASLGSPEPEAVLGIFTGTVAAKAWRRRPPLFAGSLSRLLHGLLLRWTGYLPWRRRAFLRYAADRYVLSRTGPGEYAFIHLLVRDHLAECDPDALATKVDRRITERQAREPSPATN